MNETVERLINIHLDFHLYQVHIAACNNCQNEQKPKMKTPSRYHTAECMNNTNKHTLNIYWVALYTGILYMHSFMAYHMGY